MPSFSCYSLPLLCILSCLWCLFSDSVSCWVISPLIWGSRTIECKIPALLSLGESWAAATASPWLALPPGASDCKEGRTSVCPSPSHGWVEHTHNLCTLHSTTVTSEERCSCSLCYLPSQWWKCVCAIHLPCDSHRWVWTPSLTVHGTCHSGSRQGYSYCHNNVT